LGNLLSQLLFKSYLDLLEVSLMSMGMLPLTLGGMGGD